MSFLRPPNPNPNPNADPDPGHPVVWVTGAGGLIGHAVVQSPNQPRDRRVHGLTRSDVDLEDFKAVDALFNHDNPVAIIHCAALSRTPDCERDPDKARRWNVSVTRHLVELAGARPLVFLSTDLVFDGATGNYSETASVHPQTVYAATKVEAESLVLAHPQHLVVRTSLNHGVSPSGNRAFNEQLGLAWQRGETPTLFTDEWRQPIAASVTAGVIWDLLQQQAHGLFHVAGGQCLSRWQIGCLLAAMHPELQPRLAPGSCRVPGGSRRSPNTTLDLTRVETFLGRRMPAYSQWLFENP